MRSSSFRAGIAVAAIGVTALAVTLASSAQAAPQFTPDLVGEALTNAAVPNVAGTVPSGVCSGRFIVRGGGGDGISMAAQSYPGQVTGSLTLSAGQAVVLKTGTSGNGALGGIGGFAAGGDGLTNGSYLGYGGGAASGFLLNGAVIAVGAGGGGAGNNFQGNGSGGGGGAGVGGAGQDGTSLAANTALGGALGSSTSPDGQDGISTTRDGNNTANPYGGGGGGGGWNGGQGGTFGASGAGGSNYASSTAAGINITANINYGAVASGYAGLAYDACPAPSAISSITVTPNGTSAALSFPAAASNGTPVTGYQYSIDGGTTWHTLATSGSATKSATISSLTLATALTVEVRPVYVTANIAINDVANSGPGRGVTAYAQSTSQSFTTLAQNVAVAQPTVLAQTGDATSLGMVTAAFGALIAGAAMLLLRRKFRKAE